MLNGGVVSTVRQSLHRSWCWARSPGELQQLVRDARFGRNTGVPAAR